MDHIETVKQACSRAAMPFPEARKGHVTTLLHLDSRLIYIGLTAAAAHLLNVRNDDQVVKPMCMM